MFFHSMPSRRYSSCSCFSTSSRKQQCKWVADCLQDRDRNTVIRWQRKQYLLSPVWAPDVTENKEVFLSFNKLFHGQMRV
jgi:hypothetical protein